jgi:hypothetical protein
VYLYAKASGDWFTIQDLSTDTNVPDNSAKRHAERFEELGIFKRLRIAPNHLFRLVPVEEENARNLIERIEEAAPVFEARRKSWLMREASAVGLAPPVKHDPRPAIRNSVGAASVDKEAPSLGQRQLAEEGLSKSRGSKVDLLFSLIGRPGGASLDELAATLGNQPHSVRATISVKSRERGINVRCEEGRYFLS